jgi:CoA-transferase family III
VTTADAHDGDATSVRLRELDIWAVSGAMALTGRPATPLGPPAGLVAKLDTVAEVLRRRAAALGDPVAIDPVALLGERAAISGLSRRGAVSCGGATRLLRAEDGWFALSLARPDDVELVPALLERDDLGDQTWEVIAGAVASGAADELVARGRLLGLPVAALPDVPPIAELAHPPLAPLPVRATRVAGPAPTTRWLADMLVADLSSLWAGPLCASLLGSAGAQVVKVESTSRPDGARSGPRTFLDLLNAGKRGFAVDFRTSEGARALQALLERVDVVIEGSRPRALEQLGIDARALVAGGGPRVWVSITGHGRSGQQRDRVAFGDDAAVAGGLVARDDVGPCFCADAIADPCTGLIAAAAALDALSAGGRWVLDASLAGVAAHLAGPTIPVPAGTTAPGPPRHRAPSGAAPGLGEHTAELCARIGIAP